MTDKPQLPPLDSETVAAYLRLHPEFFIDHDELIPDLRIPHQRGDTVSLVERQVKLLRERNIEMRHRLSQLMDVARDNDRLFEKSRQLVLAILDANDLEELVMVVEDSLRNDFQVPFASLLLFSDAALPVGRSVSLTEARQVVGGLLESGKTVCGALRPHELAFLFGEAQQSRIGSVAVANLQYRGLHGLLAIGSEDPQHYKSTLGTLFLGHIAEVLARIVPTLSAPLRAAR